jgi:hypothetical protein
MVDLLDFERGEIVGACVFSSNVKFVAPSHIRVFRGAACPLLPRCVFLPRVVYM